MALCLRRRQERGDGLRGRRRSQGDLHSSGTNLTRRRLIRGKRLSHVESIADQSDQLFSVLFGRLHLDAIEVLYE